MQHSICKDDGTSVTCEASKREDIEDPRSPAADSLSQDSANFTDSARSMDDDLSSSRALTQLPERDGGSETHGLDADDSKYFGLQAHNENRDHPHTVQGSISRWKKGQLLGKGGYGSVYLALNLDNGKLFAAKQIEDFDYSPAGMQDLSALENEIKTLQQCKHENIVQYLGYERCETSISIFLEYVSGGSICGLLERFHSLEESVVRVYTRQLLLGLEYLHLNGVAHRDIKGGNVLVTHEGTIKLADFGASKRIWSSSSRSARYTGAAYGIKGTAMWMAPEVIREDQPERMWKKADMWSVGCTVVEMLTGKPPWHQFSNAVTAMYHIACGQSTPDIPAGLSTHGCDFLQACFQQNPKDRPDVSTILLFPFVARAKERAVSGTRATDNLAPLTTSRSAVYAPPGEPIFFSGSPGVEAGSPRQRKRRLQRKPKGQIKQDADVQHQELSPGTPSSSSSEDDMERKSVSSTSRFAGRQDPSPISKPSPIAPAKLDLSRVRSQEAEDERVELHLPPGFQIESAAGSAASALGARVNSKHKSRPLPSTKLPLERQKSNANQARQSSATSTPFQSSALLPKLLKTKQTGQESKATRRSNNKRNKDGLFRKDLCEAAGRESGESYSCTNGGACKLLSRPQTVRVISDPFEMVQDAMNSFALHHDLSPVEDLSQFEDSYESSDAGIVDRHPLSLSSRSSSSVLSRGSCRGRQFIPPLQLKSEGSDSSSTSPGLDYMDNNGLFRCQDGKLASKSNVKRHEFKFRRGDDAAHGGQQEANRMAKSVGSSTCAKTFTSTRKLKFAPMRPVGEEGMSAQHQRTLKNEYGDERRCVIPDARSMRDTGPRILAASVGVVANSKDAPLRNYTPKDAGVRSTRDRFTASVDGRRSDRKWYHGTTAAIAEARATLASDDVSRSRSDWDKTPPLRQFLPSHK